MEKCTRDHEFEILNKAIFGNGRAGLLETTAKINEKVDNMEGVIDAIRSDVKVLVMYQSQNKGYNTRNNSAKADKKWIFTSILAVIGLLAALIKDWIL